MTDVLKGSVPQATEDNIFSCLAQLSEELELYGIILEIQSFHQKPSNKWAKSECIELIKSLIDGLFNLLYSHRMLIKKRIEGENKERRILDDNQSLRSLIEILKRDVVDKDKKLQEAELKVKRFEDKFSKAINDLKDQNAELRRVKCLLKYNENKRAHEIRKTDEEIKKLQVQLSKTIGTRCTNTVSKPVVEKGIKSNKESCDKEEMYKQIIRKFEENNRELIQENSIMNNVLCKLNTDLSALVEDCNLLMDMSHKQNVKEDESNLKLSDKIASDISLEECVALSNEHVKTINLLISTLKEKCM